MKWLAAKVLKLEQTGVDVTKVPICKLVEAGEISVRCAPGSPAFHQEDGNSFQLEERTFLTKANPSILEGAKAIEVQGKTYTVVSIIPSERMSSIRAERSKDGMHRSR